MELFTASEKLMNPLGKMCSDIIRVTNTKSKNFDKKIDQTKANMWEQDDFLCSEDNLKKQIRLGFPISSETVDRDATRSF